MASTINIKIKSNFDKASADLKKFGNLSEAEAKRVAKFAESFKTEQIDKFLDKNKRAGAAFQATGDSAKGLEIQQRNLTREMQRLIRNGLDPQDESIEKLRNEYDKLDKEVRKNIDSQKGMEMATKAATKSLIAIGAAAAAAGGFIVKNAFDTAALGDEYAKAGRRIGLTAEELQELSFAADRQGVSGDELLKGLEKLNKNVGDLRAGYGSLNTVLKSTNPELLEQLENVESNEEAFNLSVEALNDLDTQLEKASLSQALFGRSGLKLLAVTEAGVDGLADLREEAQSYGLISNKAAEESELFVDAVTNLQAQFKGFTNELAARTIPGLTGLLVKVSDFLSDSDRLVDILETVGIALAGVTAGFVTFLVVTKGAAAIQVLATAFTVLNAAIAANPIGFIAAIIATVLIPAIILLVKNWDLVVVQISTTVEKLKEHFNLFATSISSGWTVAINSIKIAFFDLATAIVEKVTPKILEFLGIAAKLPFVGEKFKAVIDTVEDLKTGFIEATAEARANSEAAIEGAQAQKEAVKKATEENIANIDREKAARLAALDEQEEENAKLQLELTEQTKDGEEVRTDVQVKALEERLKILGNVEAVAQAQNIATFEEFLEQRISQEKIAADDRIRFLSTELKRIQKLENISNDERIAAQKAVQKLITKEVIKEQERMLAEYDVKWERALDKIENAFGETFDIISSIAEGEVADLFENLGSKVAEIGKAAGNPWIKLGGIIISTLGKVVNFLREVSNASGAIEDIITDVNHEIQNTILEQAGERIEKQYAIEIEQLDLLTARRIEVERSELEWFDAVIAKGDEKLSLELERLDVVDERIAESANNEIAQIDKIEAARLDAYLNTLSKQEINALRAAGVIEETTLQRIERELAEAVRADDKEKEALLENAYEIEKIRQEAVRARRIAEDDAAVRAAWAAEERERLETKAANRAVRNAEQRLRLIENIEAARLAADDQRATAEANYRREVARFEYDRAVFEKEIKVAQARAAKASALAELPWYTSRADRNAVASIYNELINAVESASLPSPPAFAQGGSFLTSGPQTVRVGDNIGGVERVTVEPVSSSGANVNNSLTGRGPMTVVVRLGDREFNAMMEEKFDNNEILINPNSIRRDVV